MLSMMRHVGSPAAVLRGLAIVALCGPAFLNPAGAETIGGSGAL
jgi:hypothetical protein